MDKVKALQAACVDRKNTKATPNQRGKVRVNISLMHRNYDL